MSPVVGPPGWQRPAKGTRIALGSRPDASAAVGVLFTQSDLAPKIVDELDPFIANAVPAASQILSGGGLSAADRIRKGQGPPSEEMVAQRQAAQQPATNRADSIDLDSLSKEELKRLDERVTELGSQKGIYAYDAFDDEEDADVGDYENVPDESTDYAADYMQNSGAIEGAL
jgi:hypothetical protein